MSHIQSSPHPGQPVVNEITASLSSLSTRESTSSTVTLVKLSNQGRQLLLFEMGLNPLYLLLAGSTPGFPSTFPWPLHVIERYFPQSRSTSRLHIPRSRSRSPICIYLLPFFVFCSHCNSPRFTYSNRQVLAALVTSANTPLPPNAYTFLMVRMTFPRRGAENLVHHYVSIRQVIPARQTSPFSNVP